MGDGWCMTKSPTCCGYELLRNIDVIISYSIYRRLEAGMEGLRADLLRRGLPLALARGIELFQDGVVTLPELRRCVLSPVQRFELN
jgi:hypothetical protein